MPLTQGTIIDERYSLQSRLGSGAMGEVWRANDTRFESRSVAVKFLREDETLKDDAQNRDRLALRIDQQAARGPLTPDVVFDAIGSALSTTNGDGLREKIRTRFGANRITPADVIGMFDELSTDPAFNDNARIRAKLRRLFRDEANAVANLRHDNIVSIFDYGDHEGSPYLVMDYIEGRTLHQVIEGQEPLSQSRKLRLMEDLCAGLGYAHRRKLVHRDIKPANLIIDGSTDSLKILDFGVVRRLGTEATVGIPIGTFCYMSPEQTKGAATLDQRSDIFAVGLVFYELMSGKKAFPPGRGVGDLVSRIQRDPPPSLRDLVPDVNPAIEDIIKKAVAKLPDDRYQDLALMEKEIGKVRAKVEAEDTSERTRFMVDVGDQTIVKPRSTVQRPGAEMLQNAERAFAGGDDNAAIEFCKRALSLDPGMAAAAVLQSKAEARQRATRAKALIDQGEKYLATNDLRSAQTSLDQAREIAPSDANVAMFNQKLQEEIARKSQPAPPPVIPPPAPAPPARDPISTAPMPRVPIPPAPVAPSPPVRSPEPIGSETIEMPIMTPRVPAAVLGRQAPVEPPRPQPPAPSQPPPPPPPSSRVIPQSRVPQPPPAPPVMPPSRAPQPPPARPVMPQSRVPQPPPSPPVVHPPTPAYGTPAVQPSGVPQPVKRAGSNPLPILGAIAAVLILAIALFMYFRPDAETPQPQQNQTANPPPVTVPPATGQTAPTGPDTTTPAPPVDPTPIVEPPTPATLRAVQIDIRPWARVKILPAATADGQPPAPVTPEALYAPFTIELAPGDYTLEAENGGLNRNTTFPLKVEAVEGRTQFFRRNMPGFSATKIVDSLLARD